MTKRIRLNLVQLIYFPLVLLFGIIALAGWLRDLIILEWDISEYFANAVGYGILVIITFMCLFVAYCIVKLNRIITKFVSEGELEKELNLIKSRDKQ